MTTLLTKSILCLEVNTVSKHNPIIPKSPVIVTIHVCCKNNNEAVFEQKDEQKRFKSKIFVKNVW